MEVNFDRCPPYASMFGVLGCVSAVIFSVIGASYGTAKSSGAIFASGVLRPDRMMQNAICAIMAQVLGIYGLVTAVIITGQIPEKMALHTGFMQLGAGLCVGLCGLAAGLTIGIVGDAGVRGSTQQPRLYVGMILILIFAEVLGLYGVIIALMMISRSATDVTKCS